MPKPASLGKTIIITDTLNSVAGTVIEAPDSKDTAWLLIYFSFVNMSSNYYIIHMTYIPHWPVIDTLIIKLNLVMVYTMWDMRFVLWTRFKSYLGGGLDLMRAISGVGVKQGWGWRKVSCHRVLL